MTLLYRQPTLVVDAEARYNAAHALDLRHLWGSGHGWEALWALQYRPFCGGCTLDAGIGALLFGVLPPTLSTWTLVPVLLTVIAAGLAVWLADRDHGQALSAPLMLLLVFAPLSWAQLSLIGWGNHYEASLALLVAWVLAIGPRRPGRVLALGLALGLGLWIGWSALPGALGLVGWWGLRERDPRRWLRLLAGLAVGAAPMLVRALGTGESPAATIYADGELWPTAARVGHNLQALVLPQQLAGLLGWNEPGTGQWLALAMLVAAGVAVVRGRRHPGVQAALAMGAAWVGVYLVVAFPLGLTPGVIPVPTELRYAAPLVVALICATVAGASVGSPDRARWLAVLTLAPWVLSGMLGPMRWGPADARSPSVLPAADWAWFQEQAGSALSVEGHLAGARRGDGPARDVHAHALGRQAVHDALAAADGALDGLAPIERPEGVPAEPWAQGAGAALIDLLDGSHEGGSAVVRRAWALCDRVLADPELAAAARAEVASRRPPRGGG